MTKTIDKFMACIAGGYLLTIIDFLFGTVDYSFIFLVICIITDFVTGLICGAYEKKLSSNTCTKGLMKKFFIMIYVMLGHHLDILLNVNYVRVGVCYMYAVGEVLSIIENGERLGLPIPTPIRKALDILNTEEDDYENIR